MSLSAGARLGPYEILDPLGAGGMGEVYRAQETRLGRDVGVEALLERLAIAHLGALVLILYGSGKGAPSGTPLR